MYEDFYLLKFQIFDLLKFIFICTLQIGNRRSFHIRIDVRHKLFSVNLLFEEIFFTRCYTYIIPLITFKKVEKYYVKSLIIAIVQSNCK